MKIEIPVFFVMFTLCNVALYSQDGFNLVSWQQLATARFEEAYDDNTDSFYSKPVFTKALQDLNGKQVKITGYVLPMDVSLNYYVVSAFPFSSCFFCGGAGAESVVDLRLNDKKLNFKTDERATFNGKLQLNYNTVFELPFVLMNAERCD